MDQKKKLAVFDFDGVITTRDTMFEFVRFARGSAKLYLSFLLLSPFLIASVIRLYSREAAKKKFLKWHFSGMTKENLESLGSKFCMKMLPVILREKALDQIQFHKRHNHITVVVTASLDIWTETWFKRMGVEYITTLALWEEGRFLGNFSGLNCNGPEKVRRLREKIDLSLFESITVYGDSSGDKELFSIATRKFWKPFRRKLKPEKD